MLDHELRWGFPMTRSIVVLLAAIVLWDSGAWGQNLLQNPGFEEGSGADLTGWTSVTLGPALKVFVRRTDAPISGTASAGHLNLDAAGPPDEAFLYQQVAVTPGMHYEAGYMVRKYSGGLEPLDWHHLGIGLDPAGGTDYFAAGVVRHAVTPPPEIGPFQVTAAVTATGPILTFFIYSKMDDGNSAWWAHYFDDASLVGSTAPTPTPTATATPTLPGDEPIQPWRVAGSIPDRVYFIPGFVHGNHMFWFQDDSTAVLRARLEPDGTLAPWERIGGGAYSTEWGHPIIGIGDDYVYGIASWGRVRRARIGAGGAILDVVPGQTGNKWDYLSMLGEEAVFGDRGVLWNGAAAAPSGDGQYYVYCLGGFRYTCGPGCGPQNLNEVYWTRTLGHDGLLEDWLEGPALPEDVMSTTGVYYGGSIYAVGGGKSTDPQGGPTVDKVFRAAVRDDGSLGSWRTLARRLPYSARGIAAFAESGYLYVFGGLTSGVTHLSACYRAPILADGELGPWEALPSLPAGAGLTPFGRRGADVYVTGISSGGLTPIYHTRLRPQALGTATPSPVPTAAPTANPADMLRNRGFEDNSGAHTPPRHWRPFRAGGEALHGAVPGGDFDFAPQPREGSWMFGSTTNYGRPHAGAYQEVVTTAGDELALTGYGQVLKTDTGGRLRMGLDPTGNRDYRAYTVYWTDWLTDTASWTRTGFEGADTLRAADGRVTVFLELESSDGRPWNGMYLDDLLLRRVSAGNPAPTPISTPTPGGPLTTPVPPESNLLANPGFENYATGWSTVGAGRIDAGEFGAGPHWGGQCYFRVCNYGCDQEETNTVHQTVDVVPGHEYLLSSWYNVGSWTDQEMTPGAFESGNAFLYLVADPAAQVGETPSIHAWPIRSGTFHCEVDPTQNGTVRWAHASLRVTATGPRLQVGAAAGIQWVFTWNRLVVDDLSLVDLGPTQQVTPTPPPERESSSMYLW